MDYLVKLTDFVSRLSYSNLQLARKTTELRRAEELLSKSVGDKEVLLQELRHRVKNSLSIVSSFLRLNMVDLHDEAALRVFQEAIDRVVCVATIYDKLSDPTNAGRIRLDTYLANLIELLRTTYAPKVERLRVELDLETVECVTKRAVSVGLIFNELFTNALKYAHNPGEPGTIWVTLKRRAETEGSGATAELRIGDDGPGLPPGFDLRSVKGLGLRIAGLLAEELSGSLAFESNDGAGTTAVLRF